MSINITDIYNPRIIASVHSEVASNKIPYLGEGLFPAQKKTGLDLKWIKTSKGLPVSLKPSAFDAVSTIRSREGLEMKETEMAYFKESMVIKEADEQELMKLEDASSPFFAEVRDRIYNDAETLIDGARVVPERMRMSLLANANGKPSISIQADNATYAYDYDPNGTYAANNFVALSGQSMWTDTANSDPMKDVMTAQDAVEAKTGARPTRMLISKATMNLLKQNTKIKNYILAQNVGANVIVTDNRVKEIFSTELGITILVYTKQYKDEAGQVKKFYTDGMATLLPEGDLGKTWFGMTPDERTGVKDPSKKVALVETGIAVSVKITDDPDQTKTTVSEITLPSFERMDDTYMIKHSANVTY
jgi:hypothetical protein